MSFYCKAALYFHTLRYLKSVQIWGRVLFRLHRPKPDLRPAPERRISDGVWLTPAVRRSSMLSPTRFRFLNAEHEIPSPALPKLWLYNLHYFDDLNAEKAASRTAWHQDLIARWVAENPPGAGTGWEPYPLSLRIVNWVKWALIGNVLDEAAYQSLAIQVRYLAGCLERHLLGNHLFANAKALIFAGCFFSGEEATSWLKQGMAILEKEIPEQILLDGGHFERSTMYHALVYEDMLDLINLSRTFPETLLPWSSQLGAWPEVIRKMGHWLRIMCHPDGDIAFFNDAAVGVAPAPANLFAYAERLGLAAPPLTNKVAQMEASGYLRVSSGGAVLFIDAAPIGPDYLPGHAHADTLSYELSLFGQRVVVNSGTSRYGLGPEREWERSTAAHSTLEIDGENSSEVWAGFRVARRAYPFDISVRREGDVITVDASHNGYRRLPGKPVHHRCWVLRPGKLEVIDSVDGTYGRAISRIYFHPSVQSEKNGAGGTVQWGSHRLTWRASAGACDLRTTQWSPEFGMQLDNRCIEMSVVGGQAIFSLSW